MSFQFAIQSQNDKTDFSVEEGSTIIFVGANGSGKTRLATYIETMMSEKAHRISAHRSLNLNPAVVKISERTALAGLRTGNPHEDAVVNHRLGNRWQQKAATILLNDFDFVIQSLFANQYNISLTSHQAARNGETKTPSATKLEQLAEVWHRLLPKRRLRVSGDDIQVESNDNTLNYSASEMSDGERATFYLIGQTLLAADSSFLIFDEPELHIHRSIMSKLWDELEALRPDCSFLLITHDLEFAAACNALKYVIRDYNFPSFWDIESVPKGTGFDEETTTLILGSRRPILFVEGSETSLDVAIYRNCYPEWTVIPKGSCLDVIHSVKSMRGNTQLTRVTCSGIVNADSRTPTEVYKLKELGIEVLPVSEIENIVCLPLVSRAIAEHEELSGVQLETALQRLKTAIFEKVSSEEEKNSVVNRHCIRQLDQALKSIDVSGEIDICGMQKSLENQVAYVNLSDQFTKIKDKLDEAINSKDLGKLLVIYHNKGLFSLAATFIKPSKNSEFASWLPRILRSANSSKVRDAFLAVLPKLISK